MLKSENPSFSLLDTLKDNLKGFLFLKFHFKGDDLAKQIESPKWKEEFEKLDPKILYEAIQTLETDLASKSDHPGVTIKLPMKDDEVIFDKLFLGLKAAAYYPWEFDQPVFGKVHTYGGFDHVQKQLAYSSNLNSWDAHEHLRNIAICCTQLPKDHKIFQNWQKEDPTTSYKTFRISYDDVQNVPFKANGTPTNLIHKELWEATQLFDNLLELEQRGASHL